LGLRECPCKFQFSMEGTPLIVLPFADAIPLQMIEGTINFTANQCFAIGPNCDPSVDQFTMFINGNQGESITVTNGTRIGISCENNTIAALGGTAQIETEGTSMPGGEYTVNFTYTISGDTATVDITAINQTDGGFVTTFTTPVNEFTFIGDCEEFN
jgi:hypothetical protein